MKEKTRERDTELEQNGKQSKTYLECIFLISFSLCRFTPVLKSKYDERRVTVFLRHTKGNMLPEFVYSHSNSNMISFP